MDEEEKDRTLVGSLESAPPADLLEETVAARLEDLIPPAAPPVPAPSRASPTDPWWHHGGVYRLKDYIPPAAPPPTSSNVDASSGDEPAERDHVTQQEVDAPVPRDSAQRQLEANAPSTDRPVEGSIPFEETLYGQRAARRPADRIGNVIAGRYRLQRVIGEGGMGTVFEALHLDLGKRVAVKILSGLLAGDVGANARFLQEARAASAVESEHITHVFDVGEDLDAGLYMVLELLQGEDLATGLQRWGRLRAVDAAGIAVQAARALERAHAAGIVHRDLKPANVFLTRADDGSIKVKVLDFGIAKLVRDAGGSKGGITARGAVVGTPQYMSPEQAQGLPSLDRSTDVYSLGALLYECIAGKAPYPELGSYEQTILKIMMEDPPRVSTLVTDVEPPMEKLIVEMMAREPSARPSLADVRARLARIHPALESNRLMLLNPTGASAPAAPPVRTAGGVTVESTDRGRVGRPRSPSRPRGALVALVGASALLFSIAIGLSWMRDPAENSPVSASPSVAVVFPRPVDSPASASTTATLPSATGPTEPILAASSPSVAPPSAPRRSAAGGRPGTPASAPVTTPTATSRDAPALIGDAQRALDRGDAQRAIALASDATSLAPTNAEAWLTLAAAYETTGDHTRAHRAYVACVARARGARVDECSELAQH